jgi:predicted dehydrogenase
VIRVGLVGCGTIGLAHSLALKAIIRAGHVDAAVVATYDVDRDRADAFASAHADAVASTTVDELLAAVDAVWVCTPTSSHRDIVERAAVRGVAVFCEKPLAPTLADAEAMCAAVAGSGVVAQVGLVLRTSPSFIALRDLLSDRRLGPVMSVVFRDDQFFPIQGHYGSTWRADRDIAGAGTLLEHSIHDVDALRWCIDEIDEVLAAATAGFAGHEGIEDVATVLFRFVGGAVGTLTSVWHAVSTRPSTRRVEVLCRDGFVWLDDDFAGPVHVETSVGAHTIDVDFAPWVHELPGLEAEVFLPVKHYATADRAFLGAVASGAPPAPGLDEGLVAHRLVAAAYDLASALARREGGAGDDRHPTGRRAGASGVHERSAGGHQQRVVDGGVARENG